MGENDEDALVREARIRAHGQCPEYKGHAFEVGAFFFGIFVGVLGIIFVSLLQHEYWTRWAVSQGYASYTPAGKLTYR